MTFFLFHYYTLCFISLLYYLDRISRIMLNKDGSGNQRESFNISLLNLMFAMFPNMYLFGLGSSLQVIVC